MKKCILIFFIGILFYSCEKEPNCSGMTTKQLAFLTYNEEDLFKLKDEINGDTIVFGVVKREVSKVSSERTFLGDYICSQWADILFKNDTVESGGKISLFKDDYQFSISIMLKLDSLYSYYGKHNVNNSNNMQYIDTISINNVTYHNTYLFKNQSSNLYFSKDAGFLKIEEQETGKALYTIVE